MSSKPKIVVFQLKELIYTGIFVVLGILLILLLIIMFFPKNSADNRDLPTAKYVAGIYTSSLNLSNNPTEIEVVIDENHINSIRLVNLSEAVATMYPLVQPSFEDLADQIVSKQSLENVTYPEENKYTYLVLLEGIRMTLEKAEKKQ